MNLEQGGEPPLGRIVGPYRLEESLGSGGMGEVWRAWDERLRRRVAIKQIRTDVTLKNVRERLRREAQAVARLNHPAIVQVYDLLEREDGDWIVLELVDGQPLRDLVREHGGLAPQRAARIGYEIAEGLAEAHSCGILHRDLKTANVMVTRSGRVKILDFGLAKFLLAEGESDRAVSLSAAGAILGTCHAMSPEQVLGRPLDPRSDLFSLGSLLYEIVTWEAPFQGDSPTTSMGRVLGHHPPPLRDLRPEVPQKLSDLVGRLLAKEPALRLQSAGEVARALAELSGPAEAIAFSSLAPGQAAPASGGTTFFGGVPVPLPGPAPKDSSSNRRRQMGERRLLTVVCCGLVSFDEDSGEIGPLDLEALSTAASLARQAARQICQQLRGHLGAVLGHFIWMYFGFPRVQEDDAPRAVRAALELAARIEALPVQDGTGGRRPAARITVHTGPAVVAQEGEEEQQLQLGATLDLTTGLQALAPVRRVVVSAACQRLIAASFTTEAMSPAHIPGFDEPVPFHLVTGNADRQERESGAVTPLVGRGLELDLLLERFRLSRTGAGQVVILSGEAGIGKSRLVRALRERAQREEADLLWLASYASVYTQGSPFYPVVELLERTLFAPAGPAPEERLARLEEILRGTGSRLDESLQLLAPLFSLPVEGRYPPLALSPEVQRRRLFETLIALVSQLAEEKPLGLVIEDLHWVDPSTLAFLDLLLPEIPALPLWLIVTFRPELQLSWGHRAHITQINLTRLTDAETADLVDRVTAGRELPDAVRRQIVARTDGVPLFIEELTKTVLETGWTGREASIPSTLSGSLMARLDRLGDAKAVAQLASVVGRTFSFELLESLSELPPDTLRSGLDELIQAELIHRRGLPPRARYIFKHALVQDAAYASLLTKDRRRLHQRTACALEARLAESEGSDLGVIAQHFTAARDLDKAAGYWSKAGAWSLGRSAFPEAVASLERGLEVLGDMPRDTASTAREERELEIQMLLGVAQSLIRGYTAPEVERAFLRARELCRQLGEPPQLFMVLLGLANFYGVRCELHKTVGLGQEMLRLAEPAGDPLLVSEACFCVAKPQQSLGQLDSSWSYLSRAIELSAGIGRPAAFLAVDIGVSSRGNGGITQWFRGHPDEALRLIRDAVARAEGFEHPYSIAYSLYLLAWIHLLRGEVAAVLATARRELQVAERHGFPLFVNLGTTQLGWALAAGGEAAAGLQLMRQGLDGFRGLGARMSQTDVLGMIADGALRNGLLPAARSALDEALEAVEATDEREWEPELHRLHGELLLREEGGANDANGAEACFSRALDVARGQTSVSLELRAATSLARLWYEQGRPGDAREVLAGALGKLDEGWTTQDLTTARELLDGLPLNALSGGKS